MCAISSTPLHSTSLEAIQMSDFIVTVGACLPADSTLVVDAMQKAYKNCDAYISYMHPIEEESLRTIVKEFIRYEVGSEEGLLAMLAEQIVSKEGQKEFVHFFESLDIGYISAESSVGEEEIEALYEKLQATKQPVLIIGSDVLHHKRSTNIMKIASLIAKYSPMKVVALSAATQEGSVDLVTEQNNLREIEEVSDLGAYDGSVIYRCNHRLTQEGNEFFLVGSKQFAVAAKIQDSAMVRFTMDNTKYERRFKVDDQLKGTIAFNPVFDSTEKFNEYRYKQVNLEVVDV